MLRVMVLPFCEIENCQVILIWLVESRAQHLLNLIAGFNGTHQDDQNQQKAKIDKHHFMLLLLRQLFYLHHFYQIFHLYLCSQAYSPHFLKNYSSFENMYHLKSQYYCGSFALVQFMGGICLGADLNINFASRYQLVQKFGFDLDILTFWRMLKLKDLKAALILTLATYSLFN